jgi:hypothetical protein
MLGRAVVMMLRDVPAMRFAAAVMLVNAIAVGLGRLRRHDGAAQRKCDRSGGQRGSRKDFCFHYALQLFEGASPAMLTAPAPSAHADSRNLS